MQRGESDRLEELVDKLSLDVKAVMLLAKTDPDVVELIDKKINQSVDGDMQDFRKIVQRSKDVKILGVILISIGEIALASVLTISGLGIIFPTLLGSLSAGSIVRYFSAFDVDINNLGYGGALVLIVNYSLSIILLASAFYILRKVSEELSEAGLKV
ncbi:MAG: hypothetical protein ACYCT2_02485 [Thermoplasmataceae archaeon]